MALTINKRGPPDGDILKYTSLLVEDHVEIPATSEWTDGGLHAVTFATNHFDFYWPGWSLWISRGDLIGS
jgi:hypothetical protein